MTSLFHGQAGGEDRFGKADHNRRSGDFSVGIIGLLIEDGKIVNPVNEMNLSGNLTGLWNNLVEVGNDPYIYSGTRRSSFYFKDLEFRGI